jgi:chromosome segregation protein
MRLKKLQVSGFKSFVDSTDIQLPSRLVGVVGPNGCGKSNVLDAVRWVMGESSAKLLRGDSMTDVIFNGSAVRKPVGKAAVELVFDNSDGSAPGNYGQFAEISVKRTLTRDGNSSYYINNLKTRRRDVLDLFRGTGLGPRSYSIIEQGMVSRIVEARPEDLRAFVEEAAGTSRYKDRRRETETRISHTRENLDRVSDIRDELGKQLRRLKRQSASARRYKVLKEEERLTDGQLQVLRLQLLNEQVEEQDRLTAKMENDLQATVSSQRQTEAALESIRKQQSDAQDRNSEIQQEYYRTGAEISNLEQKIEYQVETRQTQNEELERLAESKLERQHQIELDLEKGIQLRQEFAQNLPEFEALQVEREKSEEKLSEAEKVLQDWLSEMEAFNEQSRAPAQQIEIQRSRIEYLEQHLERATRKKAKIDTQFNESTRNLSTIDIEALRLEVQNHDLQYEAAEKRFQASEREIKALSAKLEEKQGTTANLRNQLQEVVARRQSLQEIQNAALGGDNDALTAWLEKHGWGSAQKMAQSIRVSEGWERAADRVFGDFLGAICTDAVSFDELREHPDFGFTLIYPVRNQQAQYRLGLSKLVDKISAENADIEPQLSGIYVADTLEEALEHQPTLVGRECIVCRDGTLVGANWVSFASQIQMETGILVREEEISQLQQRHLEITSLVEKSDLDVQEITERRNALESRMNEQRVALNNIRSEMASLHNRFGREEAQYLDAQEQLSLLGKEREDLSVQVDSDQKEIDNAKALLGSAQSQTGSLDQQREKLIQRRDLLNNQVLEKRRAASECREKLHETALKRQHLEASIESTEENIKRLRLEIEHTELRLSELADKGENPAESIDVLKEQLEGLLEQKLEIDSRFSISRDEVSGFDSQISRESSKRSELSDNVNRAREVLEQQRLKKQEVMVRRDTLMESIAEKGYETERIIAELPVEATVEKWQQKLSELELKISRIGPVNLVAIEEFDEEKERMEYLDTQHADLSEALETLESVIRKIDRETRTRFRETFDKINTGFNDFFPKLFGGGKAELQLTSDDLLTTGISVIAQPPGKRNSHIHLLSGGEKALTAVALLFSLFKLNPAPFCMLDEVDAPLDDANVDRYCETLQSLAEVSQMIVITHNKITMESVELLVGVTMAEAGVSRLVSVDIEQAVEMAAQ